MSNNKPVTQIKEITTSDTQAIDIAADQWFQLLLETIKCERHRIKSDQKPERND